MKNFEKVREQIKENMLVLAEDLYESAKTDEWESVLLAGMGIVEMLRITNPHLFGKVRLMLDGSDSQTSLENRDMFL